MKIDEHAKRLIERNPEKEVLNTGHTLSTLRSDLKKREEVMADVEKWTGTLRDKKKNALEDALDADYGEKVQYYRDAEQNRIKLELLEDLRDMLLTEQLFLSKLVNQCLRQNYIDDANRSFGFDVDISGLDADAVSSAIDRSSIMEQESVDVIEEIDSALGRSGDVDMPIDLAESRREAEELEADEIEDNIGGGVEDRLNDHIKKELEQMEDNGDDDDDDDDNAPVDVTI
jgi:hypothetical protein